MFFEKSVFFFFLVPERSLFVVDELQDSNLKKQHTAEVNWGARVLKKDGWRAREHKHKKLSF